MLWMLSDREIREILGASSQAGAAAESQKPAPEKKTAGAFLLAALGVFGLAMWSAGIALILHFETSSPHEPHAQTGQIYRFNDPFSVVYLTARQHTLVDAALIVLPLVTILIVVAAILAHGRMSAVEEG